MILEYKFEYLSNNNTLINYLLDIAGDEKMTIALVRDEDNINCYAQAEQDELLAFSDKISTNLPMSMFLTNTDLKIVEEMPKSNIKTTIDKKYNLSFCPKCLQKVQDEKSDNYYNPFTTCKMCSNTSSIDKLIVSNGDETKDISEFKEVIQEVAKNINDGLKVKIKTLSGTFVFEKLDNLKDQENQTDINLLCTNLINIANVLIAKKAEVVALASIEKPQLNLKINEVYKYKNIIKTPSVNVRYSNDLMMYLISKELINYGIDFLSYKKDDTFDYSVDFNGFEQNEELDIPKVKLLSNDKLVVLESNNYDKRLNQFYEKFEESSKSQAIVALNENNLLKKKVLNFYNSTTQDDNVVLYSYELNGFLDILKYELPNTMQELFDTIANDDETGEKLLNNYKNKFPENYEKALNFDMSTLNANSIVSFWTIVETILDLNDTILNLAGASLLEKGPRIDYKLLEQEEFYDKTFNIVKLIKSGVSFRLAGVDDNTISLGYIESYTHFISSIIDLVTEEGELDGICLSGDLFTYDIVSQLVHKGITKNHKIYYNKDFPIQYSK